MWIHEVAPERLAELFHHYHEALTPDNRGSERGSWKEVPQTEKSRLVAAARLALLELESMTSERASSRQYFAQPAKPSGAAERPWLTDSPTLNAQEGAVGLRSCCVEQRSADFSPLTRIVPLRIP
ncbi:MAG: hypothetical protein WA254_10555 [Candidatus Sulfotelmatobacter sp.]